ncbi:CRE-GAR-1 protein [Aphelenchoides fujianensis]|nr:CRE-GAR-1 protein [Aphelenchoides fujianensis]
MLDVALNSTEELHPLPIWNSPYHPVVQAIIWIVSALLSLETIIGQCDAYKLERSISKQVNNRYIVSLAISDLIIGIEGIPLFTVYVVNGDRWPLGSIACNTWLFLDYTLCLVSILTVLLITTDRYLSVCKTAQYLKWQSTIKIQTLIILSWVISAGIFGVMIYFWPFISGDTDSRPDDECYAPFLANPYVNASLYVVYYWSTLVAMLILYQGIHKAAKNLESKAKAKEHRHIALLLTQRLGTQVGVSLMLQSERANSLRQETKDSGYHTNNFNPPTILESPADPTRSDTTSVILSRRLSHKSAHTLSLVSMPKSEDWKSVENVVPIATGETADTPMENGFPKETHLTTERPTKPSGGRWFGSFRFQVTKFRRRSRKKSGSVRSDVRKSMRSRSMSTSSSDSSEAESPKRADKKALPTVTVTRHRQNVETPQSPDRSSEPFLGSLGVTRKISNISSFTKDTSERVISSLFSPIAALNRGRKRTKAERRAHKAFRTITFIVGLFAILWSPYYVVATVYGFCKGECIPSLLYNLSYYLCYMNSSCNPFAYALANRQFRSAFLRLMKGNFRKL